MRNLVIAVVMTTLVAGCGGGGATNYVPLLGDQSTAPVQEEVDLHYVPQVDSGFIQLGVLKDAAGVPAGVRITWQKSVSSRIDGYYVYRDTASLPSGDPSGYEAKRVSAKITHDGGAGTTQSWDNEFSPDVDDKYYYAVTAVNDTNDESDFSTSVSITIAKHEIDSITTSDVSIGDQVTITGDYFGSDRDTDKVYFTDADDSTTVEAASYVSWSATEIVVTVPYKAADGPIGVQVGTNTVYSIDDISYNEPIITTVSPDEDWVNHNTITFTGTDFGPAPGSGGTDSHVYFGTTEATGGDLVSWTDTQIEAKVPSTATGKTVQVKVDVAGNESNTEDFVILPHIDSLSDDSGNTGDSITLTGTNFGASQSTGSVTVDGETASVSSWSNTSVTITIPAKALDGDIVLSRDDSKDTEGVGFDVVPTLDSFTPSRRLIGENVTISGSGYGAARGSSKVTFDGGTGIDGSVYVSWSEDEIVVTVPTDAETGTITVTIYDTDVSGSDDDDATSSSSVHIILESPSITDLGQL